MKTIYKYTLKFDCSNQILMPKDSLVIKFAIQNNQPCIWAIVDTDSIYENRIFSVVGTGWQIENNMRYIDTILDGQFVWHLFEQTQNWSEKWIMYQTHG